MKHFKISEVLFVYPHEQWKCRLCGLDDMLPRNTASSKRRIDFCCEMGQWVILNVRKICGTYPVRPSTVSSIGKMWILLPYLTSGHDVIDTTSDKRTRKLLRTTRFIRIFSLWHVSSERTMQTVSLRLFPFSRTVSPRNNCNSSIFAWDRETMELSSFVASSTMRRLGRSLRLRIAVAKSSFLWENEEKFGGETKRKR